jgi:4-amino-4-deoxy-L-arabinose transferase-like glycosyltransferase
VLSTNQTKSKWYWLSDLLFMALVLSLFYAVWIGSHALFTPDEGRYSEVAREMVATGDYVTPRLNGVAFLDKPVLYYWLQASAINLFGLKEWSLRFWPAFIGILGCLVTYLAGTVLFSRRTGILSGFILATCPLYYGAAHYANLDLEVAVLVSNALLFFIIATRFEGKLRSASLIAAYLFAGLAFLTKGLIGLVFPMMVIGAWILILNRWAFLKKMHLFVGLVLFAGVTIPWYILVQKANPEFLHYFFVTQQVSRFLTKGDFNNKTAFWFYIPIVLAGIFPWCIFVVQAIAQHIKKVWQNRQAHASNLFLLLWLFLVFTFFSIPKSKTVGYILPIFPAIALLVGNFLDTLWDQAKTKRILSGLVIFITLCAFLVVAFLMAPQIKGLDIQSDFVPYLHMGAALFLIGGVASFFLFNSTHLKKIFCGLLTFVCLFLLLMTLSAPAINQRSIKPLISELNTLLQPNDEIITYYKFYYDLPIYTGKRITIVADWKAPDIEQNDNWLRELWYGMPFQDTKDWLIDDNTFWSRWNSDKRLFVVTDASNYDKLKTTIKGNVYEVAQYKNVVLLSNHGHIKEKHKLTGVLPE